MKKGGDPKLRWRNSFTVTISKKEISRYPRIKKCEILKKRFSHERYFREKKNKKIKINHKNYRELFTIN